MSKCEFQFTMGPNYIYHKFHPFIKVNIPYLYKSHGSHGLMDVKGVNPLTEGLLNIQPQYQTIENFWLIYTRISAWKVGV